jgi:hypothetical protein
MNPIKSSNLSHVGYENGTLKIRFKSGAEWYFDDVPTHVHNELVNAESPGGYFRTHIRDNYAGTKQGKKDD